MKGPLHPSRNSTPIEVRTAVINILDVTLATVSDLYSQQKQAHWNIKGFDFIALHKMFDKFAEELIEMIDDIAETITRLGGTPMGTVRNSVEGTLLPEFPTIPFNELSYVSALVDRYALFLTHITTSADIIGKLGDLVTQNYYLDRGRDIQKFLWFLEATIENASEDEDEGN